MAMLRITQFLIMLLVIGMEDVSAQTLDLKGQASGWVYMKESSWSESLFGLRYLPTLSLEKTVSDEWIVDFEVSLNGFGGGALGSSDKVNNDGDVKAYRLWLRFSASQFEVRAGLQKINFGSATLLRPLRWFDRIDPRDPLQITDGVYGLLGRYYFLNNANIWLWGLYGNDSAKGWETAPTHGRSVEFGGRIQYPVGLGEIAVTYHHRTPDFSRITVSPIIPMVDTVPEHRFALDGKWDLLIGLWFEGVLIRQDSRKLPFKYRNFFTIGADYTFPLGNGVHVLGEHLFFATADKPFGADASANLSALLLSYNLGLFDRFTTIVSYDWKNRLASRYASWGRIYDNWSFYLNLFWNPGNSNFIDVQRDSRYSVGAGKGVQVMVVFNH